MHKLSRQVLAFVLSCSVFSSGALGLTQPSDINDNNITLIQLAPETQHTTASKRIVAQFTRSHYKKFSIDDALSEQIFDAYIEQLDYARNIFLASDIKQIEQYRDDFDDMITRGQFDDAYKIFNLNMQRRLERFHYALSLLDKPFDFTKDEVYRFDREEAPWPKDTAELNELWRLKVKYDALNLTLTGKEWPKVKEILTKRYHYAIRRLNQNESEDVFQLIMNSFAHTVEPHTSYLSPRNAERFRMEMNLSLEGIGAVLRAEDDYTTIQSVIAGGPADKSKQLKPNDRIVGVAQGDKEFVDVVGWRLDDVVDLIKGPKGTPVRLQVLPADADDDASIKIVSLIRDKIKLEDKAAKSEVYYQDHNEQSQHKLGVITIPSFYNNLSSDVQKELAKLAAENVEGIVVDLRGNGGGSLTEATLLTGLFIDKGPVVQIRDGADRIEINRDTDGITYYEGPLTVLVDRYSASASEIFAAAIQDYGRGVIIGEHTFGKGTVQQHRGLSRIYDLFDKPLGSIQYTIAKFYRINGGSTQHRGVLPDIAFPSAIDPADWGESKYENALPWDQIKPANYQQVAQLQPLFPILEKQYTARIKQNREFNYLLEDIAEYKKEKDDKTISLNIEIRKAKRDVAKSKRLARVNERLAAMGKPAVTSLDDLPEDLENLDPFLDEAANITFDFVKLTKVAKQ
jgi:carboxyl-terminal processing protease